MTIGGDDTPRRRARWILAGICLLAVVARLSLLWGHFIEYDDGRQIFRNAVIKDLTWDNLKDVSFTNFRRTASSPMYAINMINWAVADHYTGFAVVTLLWLVGMVLIFYRFAGVFLPERRWRLAATALFAVHSVNVDVIGWMSAASDQPDAGDLRDRSERSE